MAAAGAGRARLVEPRVPVPPGLELPRALAVGLVAVGALGLLDAAPDPASDPLADAARRRGRAQPARPRAVHEPGQVARAAAGRAHPAAVGHRPGGRRRRRARARPRWPRTPGWSRTPPTSAQAGTGDRAGPGAGPGRREPTSSTTRSTTRRRRGRAAAAAGAAGHRRGGPAARWRCAAPAASWPSADVLHPVEEVPRGTRARGAAARRAAGVPVRRGRGVPGAGHPHRRAVDRSRGWRRRDRLSHRWTADGVRGAAGQPGAAVRVGIPHGDRRAARPAGALAAPAGRAVAGRAPGATRRGSVQPDGGRTSLLDAMTRRPGGLLGAGRGAALGRARCRSCSRCWPPTSRCRLQAHPSLEQAGDGFAREDAAGIPRDAPDRNYRDANHKPELICALTEFHALVGFREPDRTRAAAARARRARARRLRRAAGRPARRRRAARAVHHVDHAAAVGAGPLVPALQDGCVRLAGAAGRRVPRRGPHGAGALRALPRRRRRAGRAAAQPGHARARRGAVPAGRQPARLPVRGRRRADGELRQRAARRAHPQARRRAGAAAGARLRRRRRRRCSRGRPDGGVGPLRHPGRGVPAAPLGGRPSGPRSRCPTAGPRILLCTARRCAASARRAEQRELARRREVGAAVARRHRGHRGAGASHGRRTAGHRTRVPVAPTGLPESVR